MLVAYVNGRGLVVDAPDAPQARYEAERWLLDEGMPPTAVAQLDVPRAPVTEAWWIGGELVDAEQDGAQAVIVVDVPDPTP